MAKTLVVVTGASSGIGATFARKLAGGHDLLLIARRKYRLESLRDELMQAYGTTVEVLQADLSTEKDIEAVAQRLEQETRLALLINNAGFGTKGRFWEASLESQEQMHRLHVMATMRLSYAALRNMVPRDFGGIINVASVAAFVRSSGSTSYSATKSWMTAFTEGLYLELRNISSKVVVQALCPGFTYSEFQDAMGIPREQMMPDSGFWMTSESVVDASLRGLSRRKLIVVPGWRYQLITSLVTKLPNRWRLEFEAAAASLRQRGRSLPGRSSNSLPGK